MLNSDGFCLDSVLNMLFSVLVLELCEFKLRSAGNLNLMWYIRREKTNLLTYTEQQVLCDWGNSFWKILLT